MRRDAVLATVVGLALCGCGSSSLSKTQLHDQATRICTTADRRTNRIPTPSSPAGGATFLAQGAAALTPELKGLEVLRPPRDVAHVYSTALRASSAELSALRATLAQLDRGGDPVSSIRALQHKLAPMEARANGAWQTLAISACVNR
jgi:hypothetical protein